MKKIVMQGEAKNSLGKGAHFFFSCEEYLGVGDKITPCNYGTTMRTEAVVLEKMNNLYHGLVITDSPIENRLDLTRIL